jgi:hypothetical protein
VFRFNMLGGTLGGFDNDEFAHLLRADAMLRGEQPLRDFADAELRGAWPSLSYAVPAWAQRVWGRSLLAEAYLTAGALALSYAVLFSRRARPVSTSVDRRAAGRALRPCHHPQAVQLPESPRDGAGRCGHQVRAGASVRIPARHRRRRHRDGDAFQARLRRLPSTGHDGGPCCA